MSLRVYSVYRVILSISANIVLDTSSSVGSAGSSSMYGYCLNKHFKYYAEKFCLEHGNIFYY